MANSVIPHVSSFLIFGALFPICRSIGDHRGDKQKFFQADCVRLLTRDEIDYIITLVSQCSYCNTYGIPGLMHVN